MEEQDIKKLLSELSLRKTNRTKSFKPEYSSPEQATQELGLALQVEVESLGFKLVVDENLNRRLSEIGRWLCDKDETGLLLYGNVGSGKTTIMDAISNLFSTKNIQHRGVNIGFKRLESVELYQMYKFKYADFDEIKKCPLLAIDDFGIEPVYINVFGTDISPISELLYHRYQNRLTTIITTNLAVDEIRKRYGDRIADRFNEMMHPVLFANGSYRQLNKKNQQNQQQ